MKLQQAIDGAKGHSLVLADTSYTTPVLISKAIRVNNDSLTIKAKGKIVLQSDSGYNGAAIQLSSKAKNIVMDSLTLVNFQVGVASFNNALVLKNMRFTNCPVQIQNAYIFADKKYINAKFPAAVFSADSLPPVTKKK